MDREIILTPGLGNATFLLSAGREAVVIDPPRDAWRVMAAAEGRGWRVTHVVETHVHNDYLSGALELRSALGSEIVAPERGRYAFPHRGMSEGESFEIDGLRLSARATPGHTPEHLAWEVSTGGRGTPTAVATGGSLLVGTAGRTDLLGADQTDVLTRAQFRSLRALAALPDDVEVLPTHGAGSFCSIGPADAERTTTIGRERRSNPLLAIEDEDTFRTALLDSLAPYPTYYREMAPINRAGPPVVGHLPVTARLTADDVRTAIAAGGHVVDGRSRRRFAAGHIAGSLNIELGDTFASYVGWFVPFGATVVLILPDPFEDAVIEAANQLFRIGYDRIAGALDGGVAAWSAAGGTLSAYPVVSAAEAAAELVTGERPHLLDVRNPSEWRDEGAVPGALEIAVGDVPDRLDALPRDRPISVMCKSGSRAAIAASMLDAAGFDVRLVTGGGAPEIAEATTRASGSPAAPSP
jgi:hydroxyacylglutathione hydrolase